MMTTQFIVGLVLAGCLVAGLPYYSVLTYKGKSNVTLIYKMCLSLTFVVSAILAATSGTHRRWFVFVMVVGFICSFIGDYFLGQSEGSRYFVIGSSFFAAAHISYAVALSGFASLFTASTRWFNGVEIGFYLFLIGVMAFVFIWKKPAFSKLIIPMVVYLFIIALMVTKAWGLGFRMLMDGYSKALVMMPIGALCFILSDYTLGMMKFKMHERTVFFKTFSTCTYFIAQALMALSLFVLTNS